jgi:hypothetical protein
MALHRREEGNKLEVWTIMGQIVGIPSTATYRIRREVRNKKVKTVNMQKLKPRHCGDGDGPPKDDKGEPGRDTKGRQIEEDSKPEDVDVSEEEGNKKQTQTRPH